MIEDDFGFPIMLSGIGMIFTWVATSALVKVPYLVPRQQVRLCRFSSRCPGLLFWISSNRIAKCVCCQGSSALHCNDATEDEHAHRLVQEVSRSMFLTKIVPLGLCSAGTMGLGNMAYQYLDVAILEMLKSCCPVFVFLVSVALKLERFSWSRALSTCKFPIFYALYSPCMSHEKPFPPNGWVKLCRSHCRRDCLHSGLQCEQRVQTGPGPASWLTGS